MYRRPWYKYGRFYVLLANLPLTCRQSPPHLRGNPAAEDGEQTLVSERRKGERVVFERGINAHMMGIDGTWRRNCVVEDVSEFGAKMTVEGSIEGLHLKEFFLLLSSTGLAYRRCELAWVNGDQVGVNFLKQENKKKSRRANSAAET
jgi:hypothetical protein